MNVTNSDNPVPDAVPLPVPRETSFVRFWRRLGGGSLMIAILLHVALLVLGAFWVLRTLYPPDREKDVNFLPGNGGGGGGNNEVQKQAQKKAMMTPTQSVKRVAVEGASSLVLPDPSDNFGQLASLSSLSSGGGGMGGGSGFGRGGGHGNGVGPGSGDGMGTGGFGAGTVFFGMEMKAKRIAYVIDYSLSMKGKREQLMRAELEKSVRKLTPMMQFQLIFFCGPAWIAGGQVDMEMSQANEDASVRRATVRYRGQEYKWESKGKGIWEPNGKKAKAQWLQAESAALDTAATYIKETPLEYGTHWVGPLEMALDMEPPPEVIVFMTDGASPGTTEDDIKKLAARARSKKTIINTMSLMEPEADDGMKKLAKWAKGTFTVIDQAGVPTEVPLDDVK